MRSAISTACIAATPPCSRAPGRSRRNAGRRGRADVRAPSSRLFRRAPPSFGSPLSRSRRARCKASGLTARWSFPSTPPSPARRGIIRRTGAYRAPRRRRGRRRLEFSFRQGAFGHAGLPRPGGRALRVPGRNRRKGRGERGRTASGGLVLGDWPRARTRRRRGRRARPRARLCGRGRRGPGEKLGRTLGVPTANIALETTNRLAFGVYAVRARRRAGPTAASPASVRPTVDGDAPLLETFLFDSRATSTGGRWRSSSSRATPAKSANSLRSNPTEGGNGAR